MSKVLVIAEHEEGRLKLGTLSAAAFASKAAEMSGGGQFEILVLGARVAAIAESARACGASAVLVADHPALEHPLADRYAHIIENTVRSRGHAIVAAAASTFSKDILPRAAAILDAAMVSDVVDLRADESDLIFKRVLYAGNALANVKLDGPIRFVTIRPANFEPPQATTALSPVIPLPVDPAQLPAFAHFESRQQKVGGRPDATESRIVVSGGRAFKTPEDFERLVGGLADALGGAVGSSRALVDAGITPNSLQIGQTGKVVAPDVYFALGISGAIQHLAGMKDTKIIVAINKDADAPIFEVADYALAADVYQAVPELIERLKSR